VHASSPSAGGDWSTGWQSILRRGPPFDVHPHDAPSSFWAEETALGVRPPALAPVEGPLSLRDPTFSWTPWSACFPGLFSRLDRHGRTPL